jgi:addiction module antitoxin, relB/dinJ family
VLYYIYERRLNVSRVKASKKITYVMRFEDNLKSDSTKLFKKFRLTFSDAINLFFYQSVKERKIPFRINKMNINEKTSNETTAYSVRLDPELKEEALELFNQLGLTLSSAVNVFLRQSIREQGIPFIVTMDNPFIAHDAHKDN